MLGAVQVFKVFKQLTRLIEDTDQVVVMFQRHHNDVESRLEKLIEELQSLRKDFNNAVLAKTK